jgi:tRNA pseudouridine13 synthase
MCALHVPEVPTGEEEVGILGFMTGTPGIGGKLKAEAEDFVVEEESLPPPEVEGGGIAAGVIRLRNWETNRFVRQMSRRLRISSRRVRFAGVKDKRAVTTQLMTVEVPPGELAALRMPDVEVLSVHATDRHVSLGDLVANRFRISVSGLEVDDDEARARVGAVMEEVREAGGLPNFYGPQRFGVSRPVSHLVGRELVRGDVEAAVWTYLAHEGAGEDGACRQARRTLREGRDVREALRSFPENLGHERTMLDHLLHNPGDHEGALRRLPFNLQLMFVHAYQGLVFNRVVSERLRRGLPFDRPVEGDVVLSRDGHGCPIHDRWVHVSDRNLAKVELQVTRGRALVSGIVPGTEAPMAGGEMGEIERGVLDELGIEPGAFRIVGLTELTSPGIRREIAITGLEPTWEVAEGRATLRFRLMKGCYATAVLRELMKAPLMSY